MHQQKQSERMLPQTTSTTTTETTTRDAPEEWPLGPEDGELARTLLCSWPTSGLRIFQHWMQKLWCHLLDLEVEDKYWFKYQTIDEKFVVIVVVASSIEEGRKGSLSLYSEHCQYDMGNNHTFVSGIGSIREVIAIPFPQINCECWMHHWNSEKTLFSALLDIPVKICRPLMFRWRKRKTVD